MPPTIDSTPAGPNANSYLTLDEAQEYLFNLRLPIGEWNTTESQSLLVIMATRTIDKLLSPYKELFVQNGKSYYRTRPQWTGSATTATQRLCWPRTGMFDQNGNVIDTMSIPLDLKYAVAELAGQLAVQDRTLDNDIIVQGIKSLKAGSVSLTFGDAIMPQVLPDAVWNLLVQSWVTDELYEPATSGIFDVVSQEDNA